MSVTVWQIEDALNAIAPFETAEDYDNVGLLLGRPDAIVHKALVALDVTEAVVLEAERLGAELIIAHHPLMFHARKRLAETDGEARVLCRLIRSRISLIAAHTNLDLTPYSGSAQCAALLGLRNVRQEGLLFLGECAANVDAQSLRGMISSALHTQTRLYGAENLPVHTLAIVGGAYDEGWQEAQALGAQALLTGEVRHHNAVAAAMAGFALLDGGHYATEAPLVKPLAAYLQNRFSDVQYKIRFYPSQSAPFGGVSNKEG